MAPGDVVHERFLIECKRTDKKSYSLSSDTVKKIQGEALSVGKEWMLVIEIQGESFTVIDHNVLVELLGG